MNGMPAALVVLLIAATPVEAGLPDEVFGDGFEAICGTYFVDADGDGFGDDATAAEACGPIEGFVMQGGDCDDASAASYPGGYEFADGADNDCNAIIDDHPSCDVLVAVNEADAEVAVRSLELCRVAQSASDWGLVAALWSQPDGSEPPVGIFDIGHGVEAGFGPNVAPQAGNRLLVLSTGTARQPSSPGYAAELSKGYASGAIDATLFVPLACPALNTDTFDGIALEVVLRAPPEATGFSIQARYYTRDWPNFVCSGFVDRATIQLFPEPMGSTDGIILFDSQLNPVWEGSVEACGCLSGPPCAAGGFQFSCPLGTDPLAGTGFEANGATGWLQASGPATPGEELILRFSIQDTSDGIFDSTLLLDDFRWTR